jgi:hypothetical protein
MLRMREHNVETKRHALRIMIMIMIMIMIILCNLDLWFKNSPKEDSIVVGDILGRANDGILNGVWPGKY